MQLETLDGADEVLCPLYAEEDGKFVLSIEGLPQHEDVLSLKSKV